MDFNAYVDKAIKSGIEAGKEELIKQTLKEDHDFILYALDNKFGNFITDLSEYLKKENIDFDIQKVIYNKVDKLFNDTKFVVTGDKVEDTCECDGTCTECTCGKKLVENEEDPDRIMLEEVPVDKQKRITIAYNTLYEAKLEGEEEFTVLKSKEDDNVFYIVSQDFDYDTNRLEFVKTVYHHDREALRIGIGKLLDVNVGDIVGVDVYEGQLVIYNTGSNVEDLTEDEVEEEPEETIESEPVTKPITLNDLLKEIQKRIVKDKNKYQPWFIQHYRIEI